MRKLTSIITSLAVTAGLLIGASGTAQGYQHETNFCYADSTKLLRADVFDAEATLSPAVPGPARLKYYDRPAREFVTLTDIYPAVKIGFENFDTVVQILDYDLDPEFWATDWLFKSSYNASSGQWTITGLYLSYADQDVDQFVTEVPASPEQLLEIFDSIQLPSSANSKNSFFTYENWVPNSWGPEKQLFAQPVREAIKIEDGKLVIDTPPAWCNASSPGTPIISKVSTTETTADLQYVAPFQTQIEMSIQGETSYQPVNPAQTVVNDLEPATTYTANLRARYPGTDLVSTPVAVSFTTRSGSTPNPGPTPSRPSKKKQLKAPKIGIVQLNSWDRSGRVAVSVSGSSAANVKVQTRFKKTGPKQKFGKWSEVPYYRYKNFVELKKFNRFKGAYVQFRLKRAGQVSKASQTLIRLPRSSKYQIKSIQYLSSKAAIVVFRGDRTYVTRKLAKARKTLDARIFGKRTRLYLQLPRTIK